MVSISIDDVYNEENTDSIIEQSDAVEQFNQPSTSDQSPLHINEASNENSEKSPNEVGIIG